VAGVSAAAALPDPELSHRRPFAAASPAQVKAALIPEEAAEFHRQWRDAMVDAADSLDLTAVQALLESWRRVAWTPWSAGTRRCGGWRWR